MRLVGLVTNLSTSPSKTLIACCSLFLGAVFVGTVSPLFLPIDVAAICFLVVCLCLGFRPKARIRFFLFLFLAVIVGLFLVSRAKLEPHIPGHVAEKNGRTVSIVGVITEAPDVRISSSRFRVAVESVRNGAETAAAHGLVQVQTSRYPEYRYGDRVHVSCALQAPKASNGIRFDRFLAKEGIWSTCAFPQMTVLSRGHGEKWFSSLLQLRTAVAERIGLLFEEPGASLMAGLLYGYRGGLGSLDESVRMVGLSHIIAVSGQNVAYVLAVFLPVLWALGVRRRVAATLGVFGVFLFVCFVGFSASVVRAGLMGSLVLVGSFLGRPRHVVPLMLLVASGIVAMRPLALVYDVGFQLSFLATIGILFLSPQLEERLSFIPERVGLRTVAATTLAATLWTAPISLFSFGAVSVVGVLSNLLVLPLIPFVMLFGFFALVASLLWFPLGVFLAALPQAVMKCIQFVAVSFAHIPFAFVEMHLSVIGFVCAMMIPIGMTWGKSIFSRV